ncbi:MAG: hypothetical protein H0X37_18555 [Herpetosiphonaceae bacterium]|nr:hypothetical protein [Herpetosiphonaceae bacterium]
MDSETITIRVAPDAARAFRAAQVKQQRKLEALLSLRLSEIAHPDKSLEQVMREISRNAQARGLTPEILASILDEA